MSKPLAAADLSGLPPRGRVVVGFSGGADSTALAHCFWKGWSPPGWCWPM